jgi:hypothetical protein
MLDPLRLLHVSEELCQSCTALDSSSSSPVSKAGRYPEQAVIWMHDDALIFEFRICVSLQMKLERSCWAPENRSCALH